MLAGLGGHDPEEDARAYIYRLRAKIMNNVHTLVRTAATKLTFMASYGLGYEEVRVYSMPARIARSHSRNPGQQAYAHARLSATKPTLAPSMIIRRLRPPTTVACANDAEVLDRLLGSLNSHKIEFGRLTGLTDAFGYA